ncbi:hypothetical protein [Lysobacter sp. HA18]
MTATTPLPPPLEREMRALARALRHVWRRDLSDQRDVLADLLQRVEAMEAHLRMDPDAPVPRVRSVIPFHPRPRPRTSRR